MNTSEKIRQLQILQQKQQVSSAEAAEYFDSIQKIFQQKISTKSNIIGEIDESIASSIGFYDPISDFWYPKWGRSVSGGSC